MNFLNYACNSILLSCCLANACVFHAALCSGRSHRWWWGVHFYFYKVYFVTIDILLVLCPSRGRGGVRKLPNYIFIYSSTW